MAPASNFPFKFHSHFISYLFLILICVLRKELSCFIKRQEPQPDPHQKFIRAASQRYFKYTHNACKNQCWIVGGIANHT
jgi:hypothetical protein